MLPGPQLWEKYFLKSWVWILIILLQTDDVSEDDQRFPRCPVGEKELFQRTLHQNLITFPYEFLDVLNERGRSDVDGVEFEFSLEYGAGWGHDDGRLLPRSDSKPNKLPSDNLIFSE